MQEKDIDARVEQMIDAALGGRTPHQALIEASRAEAANVAERNAAIEKNRARARALLEQIEKSLK